MFLSTGNQNAKIKAEMLEAAEALNHLDVANHIVRTEKIDTTQIDDMANHLGSMTTPEESDSTTETGKYTHSCLLSNF